MTVFRHWTTGNIRLIPEKRKTKEVSLMIFLGLLPAGSCQATVQGEGTKIKLSVSLH